MEDIAPGLLKAIQQWFSEQISADPKIQALLKRITEGNAAYADTQDYAYLVGNALSLAFEQFITQDSLPDGRMYYNIAQRVVRPMLLEDHIIVSSAAVLVQKALNEKAGIGIKPQTVPVNENRVSGILDKISNAQKFQDVAWVLTAPVENFSMNVADETLRANVDFQGRSGLRPKVIRKSYGKCCAWCSKLEGEYDYPNIPRDVYRRHENCRCTVDYDPGDGRRQNVHSKQWTSAEKNDILEKRKLVVADGGYRLTAKERLTKKKLKNGFSAFPEGDVLNEYVAKTKSKQGVYDVAMHGSPSAVCFGSSSANMTARNLATYLKHQDSYKGGPVRLLSCNTGKRIDEGYCFAEELANALGSSVEAPNDLLFFRPDGTFYVGKYGTGQFVTYKPNERGFFRAVYRNHQGR